MESAGQSESISKPEKLGPTATAITAALESNQSLQTELKRRLVEVRRLQLQNRLHAAQVTRSLSLCWDSESYQRSPEGLSALDVGDAICGGGRSQNLHQTSIQRCTTPRMDSNPSRKWKRHFFVGADGSTPDITVGESSASTEAKVEAATTRLGLEFENSNEEKRPLAWSKEDVITLQRVAHEAIERLDTRKHDSSISKDTNKSQTTIPWDDNSYFEEVAANLGTNHPRSAEECRLALLTFADVNIVTAKFTKEESLFILREVAQAEGGDVDWYELTCKLNLQFYKEPQRRTTWQCFKQYQSSLRDSTNKCPPWTADEDELLLKYIAAHGPQFVFAESAVSQACQNLFPLRDPKSVKYRAQSTLVNPNFVNDRWDVTEQRKLALLMRAYSDQHITTPNSDHFPHRSQVSKTDNSILLLIS